MEGTGDSEPLYALPLDSQSHASDGTIPQLGRDERNRPTTVRKWFSRTQERLKRFIPGGGVSMLLMKW